LAAVALVLISFLPLIETLQIPIVGLVALAVILTALVARLPLPGRVPGALGALIVSGTLYYAMRGLGLLAAEPHTELELIWLPTEWLSVFRFEWVSAFAESLKYLPIVLPFALATVVGGIDCTESAAAAGDEYDAGWIVGVEAVATIMAALCGGVIQTTPYIGHPAYKAMGGRAAYTLATALFVGSAGVLGYFSYLYAIIPKPTVFPILVFIGLEITAQSFHATKKSHYPAVALACVPALAALVLLYVDHVLGDLRSIRYTHEQTGQLMAVSQQTLSESLQAQLRVVRVLANGFIITSLLWAATLSSIIDRQLNRAAVYLAVTALVSLFGVIHSPLPGSPVFLPWRLERTDAELPVNFCCGYLLAAALLWAWQRWLTTAHRQPLAPDSGQMAPGSLDQ
jgi:AGZA family xanthine/uracil permease-like MFS transporter